MGNKWDQRDRKRHKARYGMRVTGRSIITIQQALAEKRRKKKGEVADDDPYLTAGAAPSPGQKAQPPEHPDCPGRHPLQQPRRLPRQ